MVQVERHRETAQEHEWLDMEEYDNVVDDLRRKQRAAARRRVEPPHNSTLFGADVPISLSSDDKTALAVVVSGAMSTPGAYHGDGDNNVGPKPTQDQLMDIARLRNVQKNRQHGHSTDRGIIRYHPDTDDNIDDLQARMNGFNSPNDAVEQSEEHRQQLQRKKRRRNMVIGLLVVIVIGAVVGIIVTIIGEKSKETATDGSNSISDVFSNPCASQSDEAMSERYLQLRSLLDVSVPSMAATINAADSNQRVALCWLSELDGLQADVRENKLVQRFLLVAVYLHFVKQAESGDTTATFDLASRNWLTDAHECDWDFIECDEDQKVNALLLNHLGLTGSIPTELTLLSTLEMIELAVNDLTGEVTSGLWSMPKLEQLRLDGNMLRGAIFEGTRSISALKSINIRNNKFTGTLPQNWDMPNLEFFRVANNKFEGMVPDLSTSTKLDYLDLSYLGLSGTIPEFIWKLTTLSIVALFDTNLSGTIASEIGLLEKLEYMDFGLSRFAGTIPSELGQLSALGYCNLIGTQCSGKMPAEVCALVSTRNLTISVNEFISCDCCD